MITGYDIAQSMSSQAKGNAFLKSETLHIC